MKISYYAIFQYNEDGLGGLWVRFPDLPGCFSCGDNFEHAKQMAEEALNLFLDDMAITQIPKPTSLSNIVLDNNQIAVLITTDMKVKDGKLFGDDVIDFNSEEESC